MKKEYYGFFAALRGACIAAAFLFVSSITTLSAKISASVGDSFFRDMKDFVVYIFCTVAAVLIFNSIALAFAYSDREQMNAYLEREDREVHLFSELSNTFKTPALVIELASTHIIILLASALGAFSYIEGMFNTPAISGGWFSAITLTPLCLLLSLLSKYEAARFWHRLDEEGNLDKLEGPSWFVVRIIFIAVLYPIALPIAPLLVFAIISLFSVFAKLSALLTAVGTVVAIILLLLLVWAFKVLFGISKRKKLLRRIRKTAEENGYSLFDLKNPYRSFATSRNFCTFSLRDGEKSFDCVIISTLNRSVPLVFTSTTDAVFIHRLGTKNHGISIRHNIEFFHVGNGDKMIIVDPVPKGVWVSENNVDKRIYSADRIWGIAVHDSDSFIGCMERHCLDSGSKR